MSAFLKPLELIKRLSCSELFMDTVSSAAIAAGCLAAILPVTVIGGGVFLCLWVCALATIFFMLISRRRWAPFIAFGGLALVFLGFCVYMGFGVVAGFWLGFLDWTFTGAVYEANITNAGYLAASLAAVVLAVCGVLFVLVRKLFFFPALVVIVFGVIIASYIIKEADMSPAIATGAAGLIVLLPRVYAARLKLAGGGDSVSRARMQAVAVPAAVFAVLLAVLFIPKETVIWQSHALNTWIDDLGEYFGDVRAPGGGVSGSFSNFSLNGVGYTTMTGKIGGPIELSNTKYLQVWADRPILLKGSVLVNYNGSGWTSGYDGDLRLNSPLWGGTRKEEFDNNKPIGDAAAAEIYKNLTTDTEISVVAIGGRFNALFIPENTYEIKLGNRFGNEEIYFNRRGEAYLHSNSLLAVYTAKARVWNTNLLNFDELFDQLEAHASDARGFESASAKYTALPEDLPASVRHAANEIAKGAGSPYQKAKMISDWLYDNCTYTLRPDIPPKGEDFTKHFLETREGYCVYFATAMTVLARCAGLPARYVQGFALAPDDDYGYYWATGETAHSWSEVYFEGIGWLPMDPLRFSPGNAGDSARAAMAPAYQPPAAPSFEAVYTEGDEFAGQRGAMSLGAVFIALIIAAAIGGAFLCATCLAPGFCSRRFAMGRLARLPDNAARLSALYGDMLRLLSLFGLYVLPGETLITFPRRVNGKINIDGFSMDKTAAALMRMHFKQEPPDEEDLSEAAICRCALDAAALSRLGGVGYLFKRAIPLMFFKV